MQRILSLKLSVLLCGCDRCRESQPCVCLGPLPLRVESLGKSEVEVSLPPRIPLTQSPYVVGTGNARTGIDGERISIATITLKKNPDVLVVL